jgi:hypothetical protein
MMISSLHPFAMRDSASFKTDSEGLLLNPPRIPGMAQYAQRLSQPSAILM